MARSGHANRTGPTKPISCLLSTDMLRRATYSRLGRLLQTPQGANSTRVTHFAISLIGIFAFHDDRKSRGSAARGWTRSIPAELRANAARKGGPRIASWGRDPARHGGRECRGLSEQRKSAVPAFRKKVGLAKMVGLNHEAPLITLLSSSDAGTRPVLSAASQRAFPRIQLVSGDERL